MQNGNACDGHAKRCTRRPDLKAISEASRWIMCYTYITFTLSTLSNGFNNQSYLLFKNYGLATNETEKTSLNWYYCQWSDA